MQYITPGLDGKTMIDFIEFPKMARLTRECIITEKIDGTNAQIFIGEDGEFKCGSRTRWITPDSDNAGFARWAYERKDDLIRDLGAGRHFGEWWGNGIQRNYNLPEKIFSLFNVTRWGDNIPEHCHVVPVLYRGIFCTDEVEMALIRLIENGSKAAPGFMRPEGIVVFHIAAGIGFKKTIEKDDQPKSLNRPEA
jgi:hypothetical protein